MQGCIKFLIKSVWEEYQVLKRGREYHGGGKEYNAEKKEWGSNLIFPKILRMLGRISSGEKGKKISGKKIKIEKMWMGKNIKF